MAPPKIPETTDSSKSDYVPGARGWARATGTAIGCEPSRPASGLGRPPGHVQALEACWAVVPAEAGNVVGPPPLPPAASQPPTHPPRLNRCPSCACCTADYRHATPVALKYVKRGYHVLCSHGLTLLLVPLAAMGVVSRRRRLLLLALPTAGTTCWHCCLWWLRGRRPAL